MKSMVLNAELAHQMSFIRVNVDQIDTMPSDGNPVAWRGSLEYTLDFCYLHVYNAEQA